MSRLTLTQAHSPDDLAAVRTLCWGYHEFLLNNSDVDHQITQAFYPAAKYAKLMEALPVEHARPQGVILLAHLDGTPAGCGMTHALDPQTSEMKRVFTNEAARGKGVARQICSALMDQARSDGFTRMVLDTSRTLTGAQQLYAKLGFSQRGPYQPIPENVLPDLLFYEITL